MKVKKAYFLKGKKTSLFQEEFNPTLCQPVQNLTIPWCEYRVVSPCMGFGTHEAQVLFTSETGSTAVPARGPATHHLHPLCTVLAGVGRMDRSFPGSLVLCGP